MAQLVGHCPWGGKDTNQTLLVLAWTLVSISCSPFPVLVPYSCRKFKSSVRRGKQCPELYARHTGCLFSTVTLLSI